MEGSEAREFSNSFELDGQEFLEPNTHLFSFNNPYGACPTCEGYGDVIGIDEEPWWFQTPRFQSMKMRYFHGVGTA